MHTAPELNERRGNTMDMIDSSRRGFLKSAVAAGAAVMASAAANAGIPASSVKKYDETFDVVIIGSGFAGMACAYTPCRKPWASRTARNSSSPTA